MAIIPMVSAVTLPTSAFFCDNIDEPINDCIYAGDGDAGFSDYSLIGSSNKVREWYNFTEGFGNGIIIHLYAMCHTASLDYVQFGCKSYSPVNDFFVLANLTLNEEPSERQFTVPNNCLNPEDNQTVIFYISNSSVPETTNLNAWFDNYFTELDAPLTPNATISIVYPNNITYNSTVDNFEYIVADAQSCWYSTDLGATNNSLTCGQNVTGLNANNTGSYTWYVYANNSDNNLVSDAVTFNVLLPLLPSTPNATISITYPTNITYNVTVDNLEYEVSDAESCWYSTDLGATNNSLTCGQNVTGLNYSVNGTYTWYVYANNSENTLTSDSVTFEVAIPQPSPSPSPSPSPQQQDIVYSVLASSGTGLGVFLEAIRSPLVAIILGIGVILGIVGIVYVLSSTIKNYLGSTFKK